jgi:uncharacterized protein YjbJ (UPF0337 family)
MHRAGDKQSWATTHQEHHGQGADHNEERLRALTSDRKAKARGKAPPNAGDAQHRPGDIVDAVRERTKRDLGRDTPG